MSPHYRAFLSYLVKVFGFILNTFLFFTILMYIHCFYKLYTAPVTLRSFISNFEIESQ